LDTLATATVLGFLILLASILSVELGISVAIIEIALGVFAGNVLGVTTKPWIDFLASFAGIVLTFLAGAEVDPALMREKLRESVTIGGLSFLLSFVGCGLFAYYVAGRAGSTWTSAPSPRACRCSWASWRRRSH